MLSNHLPFRFRTIFDVRAEMQWLIYGGAIGALFAYIAGQQGMPLWVMAAFLLAGVLPAYGRHVYVIYTQFGWWSALLAILVAAQSFHGVEHVVQWIQYHILRWPFFKASGIISAANSEWVHFVWNWMVLVCMIALVKGGLRNRIAWLMLAWTIAHTAEHTYLMYRYQQTLNELAALGAWGTSAQGLPGFFGRDGWLATSDATRNTFICRLPGFTTAVRLDVHFWWNIGETLLLWTAAAIKLMPRNDTPATPLV